MKNEVHLFHEMQEISINLPIIFQILSLTKELSWEDKMRLNIKNIDVINYDKTMNCNLNLEK